MQDLETKKDCPYLDLNIIGINALKSGPSELSESYPYVSYNEIEDSLTIGSELCDEPIIFSGMRFRNRGIGARKFKKITIKNCLFLGFVDIYCCDENKQLVLQIDNCIFKDWCGADNSFFRKIEIDHCVFEEVASFTNVVSTQISFIRRSNINKALHTDGLLNLRIIDTPIHHKNLLVPYYKNH